MDEARLRAEVVKRRKQLKRSEDGEFPERTWSFMIEMGWVQDATEMFDDDAVDYLAGWLDKLDEVAPSGRPRYGDGNRSSGQESAEDDKESDGIEEGQEYFEVEVSDNEKERQR